MSVRVSGGEFLQYNSYLSMPITFQSLTGVEDIADLKQQRTKGRKNEENNSFVGPLCFTVLCHVFYTRKALRV